MRLLFPSHLVLTQKDPTSICLHAQILGAGTSASLEGTRFNQQDSPSSVSLCEYADRTVSIRHIMAMLSGKDLLT